MKLIADMKLMWSCLMCMVVSQMLKMFTKDKPRNKCFSRKKEEQNRTATNKQTKLFFPPVNQVFWSKTVCSGENNNRFLFLFLFLFLFSMENLFLTYWAFGLPQMDDSSVPSTTFPNLTWLPDIVVSSHMSVLYNASLTYFIFPRPSNYQTSSSQFVLCDTSLILYCLYIFSFCIFHSDF